LELITETGGENGMDTTIMEVLVTREQALEEALKALGQLLCATNHYGFTDKHSEEFWELRGDTAAENGQSSDDIRREVWETARRAYNDAVQLW
jgi:hypothetical protein